MNLHPLLVRLIKSLGLPLLAVEGLSGCGEPPPDYNLSCPNTFDIKEPVPGCTLDLEPQQTLVDFCVAVPLTAKGTCPPNADGSVKAAADEEEVPIDYVACGPVEGTPDADGKCCYFGVEGYTCVSGRPFLIEGKASVAPVEERGDWLDDAIAAAPFASERLAGEWLQDAAMEHASVAAFARFTLELLAVGAPADLVEEAQRAALDEVRHARMCFALAARYGGRAVGPGRFEAAAQATTEVTLQGVVRSAVLEGCVGETIAAIGAMNALRDATDPAVCRVLSTIAEDEGRHAALAWRFVAWAIGQGGEPIREVVERALAEARASLGAQAPARDDLDAATRAQLRSHGRLDAASRLRAAREAFAEVISPCARALTSSRSFSSTEIFVRGARGAPEALQVGESSPHDV